MISTNFANEMIGRYFGLRASTPPEAYYLGLSTTAVTSTAGNITEPSGGGYSRVRIANTASNFSAPVDGKVTISNEFVFPEATADWGVVTHYFLASDANSTDSADIKIFGELTKSRTVESGTTLKLNSNDFSVELHTCENE